MDVASVTLFLCSTISYSSSSLSLLKKGSGRIGIGIDITRRRKQWNKGLTCNALLGLLVYPSSLFFARVAALVFSPKNLPQLGRNIGKTVESFQQAAKEFEFELKKEPSSVEEQEKQDIGVWFQGVCELCGRYAM